MKQDPKEFPKPGETYKAHKRRTETKWFEKYAPLHKPGIDIGCADDPLTETFRRWDKIFGDGDATYMEGVPDNTFMTCYSSHCLEHIVDYKTALKNWYRILKPGGHLIIVLPHRDLYEKKKTLKSNWNPDHKWFFLPDSDDPESPCTLNAKKVITEALPEAELVSFEILNEGFEYRGPDKHSFGEYSIEIILKKPLL